MTAADYLSLVVGAAELLLVAVVLRGLLRFGRGYPWLAALGAYFAVRGAVRLYSGFAGAESEIVDVATDGIVLLVLVLLALGMGRTVGALSAAEREASWYRDEYERALADLRTLVRHRVANPLSVIHGGVQTLRARDDLDPATRRRMLDEIERAAAQLGEIATTPDAVTPEERALEARPRVDDSAA